MPATAVPREVKNRGEVVTEFNYPPAGCRVRIYATWQGWDLCAREPEWNQPRPDVWGDASVYGLLASGGLTRSEDRTKKGQAIRALATQLQAVEGRLFESADAFIAAFTAIVHAANPRAEITVKRVVEYEAA